jgi:peptide/nickel transport system ATP-binding protein
MSSPAPALAVNGLTVALSSGEAVVEDISLAVSPGEILGLVGESGCGKTTTALALLGYCQPGARIVSGEITVAGETMSGRSERAARRLRGRLVSYVPQDPGNALNPALRIRRAVQDMLDEHAAERELSTVDEALDNVHLPASEEFAAATRTSSRAASSSA